MGRVQLEQVGTVNTNHNNPYRQFYSVYRLLNVTILYVFR